MLNRWKWGKAKAPSWPCLHQSRVCQGSSWGHKQRVTPCPCCPYKHLPLGHVPSPRPGVEQPALPLPALRGLEVPPHPTSPAHGCIPQWILDTLTPSHSVLKSQIFWRAPREDDQHIIRSCQCFPLQPQGSDDCGAPPFLPLNTCPAS